jgi:hypothetical protein
LKDETIVHLRLKGIKILTIDHENYAVNNSMSLPVKQQVQSAPDTAERIATEPRRTDQQAEQSDSTGYR